MASAREKNGRWYYRITISESGKKKYIERGGYFTKDEALEAGIEYEKSIKPIRDISNHVQYKNIDDLVKLVTVIFERFPEGHPYHIPLLLSYKYGLDKDYIFNLQISDVNRREHILGDLYLEECDWKVLIRHIRKVEQCRSVMNHKQCYKDGKPVYYLNVRYTDGSYISKQCMNHASRIIRGKEGNLPITATWWNFQKWRTIRVNFMLFNEE